MLDTVEEFVTGVRPVPDPGRFLGTVLFVDVAESTRLAAEIGDSRFKDLLSGFIQLVRRHVDRYQGRLVDTAGDGALALFDSPARAIGCAESVRDGARALGLPVRAGCTPAKWNTGPRVRSGASRSTPGRGSPRSPTRARSSSPHHPGPGGGRPHPAGKPRDSRTKGVPGSWEIFAVAG